MAEILRWGDVSFFVETGRMRSFTGLEITSGSETEDKKKDGQKYVSRKAGNGHQVDLTATLDGRLGEDVMGTAVALTQMAQAGTTGFLYTKYGKLFPCMFMMVAAKAGDIQINPGGGWLSANVALTLKQCDKPGAGSASGGKKTVNTPKKQSVKTEEPTSLMSQAVSWVQEQIREVGETLTEAKKYAEEKAAELKTKAKLGQAPGNAGGWKKITRAVAQNQVTD